jgi:hypothetical protein
MAVAIQSEDQKTWLGVLQDDWTSFAHDYLAPMGDLLVPFISTLAVLLVFSRLLVIWVARWPRLEQSRSLVLAVGVVALVAGATLLSVALADALWPPFSPELALLAVFAGTAVGLGALVWAARMERREHVVERTASVGVAILVLTAVGLAARQRPGDDFSEAVEGWAAFGAGVLLSGLGTVMAAWWLATRLRLEVKVTDSGGKESPGAAGLIIALLGELGVQKPNGLEVPRGTDVTALAGAFATLPDSPLAKAIKSVVSGIAGVTPWTASVEGDGTTRSVSLSRNGRSVDSTVIRLESMGFSKAVEAGKTAPDGVVAATPDAALRMAAAFILVTLAGKHKAIEAGLADATSWRSVGLHYIAATELVDPSEEQARKSMLARALQLDPGNLAAQLSFRHAMDRQSTDAVKLIAYRNWLEAFEPRAKEAGARALELRAKYTRTVIAVNALFAQPTDDTTESLETRKAAVTKAYTSVAEWLHGPEELAKDPDFKELAASVKQGLMGLELMLGLEGPGACKPESPTGLYNLACFHASHDGTRWRAADNQAVPAGAPEHERPGDADALAALRLAAAFPEVKNWMSEDPQLAELRGRKGYGDAFNADPKKSFLDLSYVKPLTESLRLAGMGSPGVLGLSSAEEIGFSTGYGPQVGRRLMLLAQLYRSIPPLLERWRVEIVDLLDERDLGSMGALKTLTSQERSDLAESLAADLRKKCKLGSRLSSPEPAPSRPLEDLLEAVVEVVLANPAARASAWASADLLTPVKDSLASPAASNGSPAWDRASLTAAIKDWLMSL